MPIRTTIPQRRGRRLVPVSSHPERAPPAVIHQVKPKARREDSSTALLARGHLLAPAISFARDGAGSRTRARQVFRLIWLVLILFPFF